MISPTQLERSWGGAAPCHGQTMHWGHALILHSSLHSRVPGEASGIRNVQLFLLQAQGNREFCFTPTGKRPGCFSQLTTNAAQPRSSPTGKGKSAQGEGKVHRVREKCTGRGKSAQGGGKMHRERVKVPQQNSPKWVKTDQMFNPCLAWCPAVAAGQCGEFQISLFPKQSDSSTNQGLQG